MSIRPPPQLQRRGATAALAVPTMSPHPRPTISMEDWEAKAPLGDAQLRSIAAVKAAAEHLPLPLKVRRAVCSARASVNRRQFSARDDVESSGASRPDTPRGRLVGTGVSSRPSTPGAGRRPGLAGTAASRAGTSSLRPTSPVRTAQAFLDLVARVEHAAAHAQEGDFRARLAELRARRAECARVLGALDTVQTEVAEMLARWRAVEAGGASLEGACERLLAERARLGAITDEVDARLEFFAELERATRVLNAPGEALVLQDDFLHMVDRIDACIAFLREHVRPAACIRWAYANAHAAAALQGVGGLPPSLPAVPHARDDAGPDVLRRLAPRTRARRRPQARRGAQPVSLAPARLHLNTHP
jgi:hypothetical protein